MSTLDPLTWAILLMLIGCGLVVLEVFLPSGGLLSFFSATAVIASIVMAFNFIGDGLRDILDPRTRKR